MVKAIYGAFTTALILVVFSNPLKAITIDDFSGFQETFSEAQFRPLSRSSRTVPNGVGGFRSFSAQATSGLAGRLLIETTTGSSSRLQHSQDVGVTGVSTVHWDGNSNAANIDPSGLGGVDLTDDGGSSFIFTHFAFGFPFGTPLNLTVRVFDASDQSGDTFSEATVILNRPYRFSDKEDLFLPFSSFTVEGPSGPADFSNVGAIWLQIDGAEEEVDIGFDDFKTDGDCDLVPQSNGKVLDECGDCIPENSSLYNKACSDCLGVPNGIAVAGTSCQTGDPGPCAPGSFSDTCECVPEQSPRPELCDGIDNDCDGDTDEVFTDLGGVCTAGEGSCFVQGIFECNGQGGIFCNADFDPADLDGCGLDIGCDGLPGSGKEPDRCGVCGGDGSSCDASCESINISAKNFALDGGAKEQELLIRGITRRIRTTKRTKRTRKYTRRVRDKARELQVLNWVVSWQIPSISVQCAESEFCVTTSNAGMVSEYINRSEDLRNIGLHAAKRLRKAGFQKRQVRRWRRRVRARHNENLDIAISVPLTQSVCS